LAFLQAMAVSIADSFAGTLPVHSMLGMEWTAWPYHETDGLGQRPKAFFDMLWRAAPKQALDFAKL